MGHKETKQTVTYAQQPLTQQQQTLQSEAHQGTDPSIPFAFAQQRSDLQNSFMNPLGAATTPAVRDASNRVAGQRQSMNEAEAVHESKYANDQANFNRQAVVANSTAPVQVGGSQSTSGGFWSNLLMQGIGAGANVGAAAL